MIRVAVVTAAVLLAAAATAKSAAAQVSPSPNGSAEQRAAIARLDRLNGEWRGTAVTNGPGGPITLTQTERVGNLLGGSIKLVEGRGYAADGSTQFNALGVISWDARAGRYAFRAYAQGFSGDYPFEVTEDGFKWESPAGPGAKIQYVATIKDGVWHEIGDYVAEGRPPVRYIEMRLTRVGDTRWPAEDPVAPR